MGSTTNLPNNFLFGKEIKNCCDISNEIQVHLRHVFITIAIVNTMLFFGFLFYVIVYPNSLFFFAMAPIMTLSCLVYQKKRDGHARFFVLITLGCLIGVYIGLFFDNVFDIDLCVPMFIFCQSASYHVVGALTILFEKDRVKFYSSAMCFPKLILVLLLTIFSISSSDMMFYVFSGIACTAVIGVYECLYTQLIIDRMYRMKDENYIDHVLNYYFGCFKPITYILQNFDNRDIAKSNFDCIAPNV